MKLTREQIGNACHAWLQKAMEASKSVRVLDPKEVIKAVAPHVQYATIPETWALTDEQIAEESLKTKFYDTRRAWTGGAIWYRERIAYLSRRPTQPAPERTFTLKQLRDAGRYTGCSDAVEEVISVLNPPPAPEPAAPTGNPIAATSVFPSSEKCDVDFDVPQATVTKLEYSEAPQTKQERVEEILHRHTVPQQSSYRAKAVAAEIDAIYKEAKSE